MHRLLAVLVPLVLLAAACGDDDDADDGPTTTVAGSPAQTSSGSDGDGEDVEEPDPDVAPDTTVPETTVPVDAPAGDAPGEGSADDEGLGDALLVSDLTGGAEVPGPGDPTARGRFEAELHEGVLCVDMVVSGSGAAVSGAHLHAAAAGEAGPVIVDVGAPTTTADDTVRWAGACTEVDDDVIQRIADAPERVYVNVHTETHPDGAVRGQLSVASVFDRTLDR